MLIEHLRHNEDECRVEIDGETIYLHSKPKSAGSAGEIISIVNHELRKSEDRFLWFLNERFCKLETIKGDEGLRYMMDSGRLKIKKVYDSIGWNRGISYKDIPKSWRKYFAREDIEAICDNLQGRIRETSIEIYPKSEDVFASMVNLKPKDVRVVILGQDCYHQPGQAMGLSFSVQEGIVFPPSLQNIFKELKKDIEGYVIPKSGNLTGWKEQGVLLLNSSLTVERSKAGSHISQWESVTDNLIKGISDDHDGIIFLLWGNYAKRKRVLIDTSKHIILEASHPSPLSANRGGWFGTGHFSKCNRILEERGNKKINW
jgi:uracil-DNA glycosylase